jgi:transposase InsO family protein
LRGVVTQGASAATDEEQVEAFLQSELAQFDGLMGVSSIAEHTITMRDEYPIKQRYYPKNPAMQKIINEQVDELLRDGRIEPSRSPYSAPIVLVGKKTGEMRMCVDYRQLNAKSIPDAYPLPRINHILEKLKDAKYISTLDLKSGYWQIPMARSSREYTAFTVPGRGLFHWKVMPFGLHSAPATFQRALDGVIGPDMEPHAFAYLDDIIVVGRSLQEHMDNLREVFRRLRNANLRLNKAKCSFFKKSIIYLGHQVSEGGIHTDPGKIAAIKELQPPTTVRELRRCLGIASWYRRFVPNFATLVQPMSTLLKKGRKWVWSEDQQRAFEALKTSLTQAPVLACPDFAERFTLQTDASDIGLGAVLTQQIQGTERVIAYASRRLSVAESRYSTTEKECLAIVWAIRKLRCYLEGYEFDVVTDHLALKWLNSIENPTGRIARWALELQQFRFNVHYRRGDQNIVADALSRQPLETLQQVTQERPPCTWTTRMLDLIKREPEKYPEYLRENDQLYRRGGFRPDDEDYTPWKLCVPKPQRQRVLDECHDQPTAGHQGVRKTLNRIRQRYCWPGLFRDVARYVRKCETCQKFKVSQLKPPGQMHTRQVHAPFDVLCADFVGPLPRSTHGNTMLLVFFDAFSKLVELVPLRKATAAHLMRSFRERILARFGVPKMLVCDNGTQFTSRAFAAFCGQLGMSLQHTAPYTPQQNPTERVNRTVKTMVAQYLDDQQRTWDERLPEISLAINTSASDTTGFSPAYLIQGREPRLPGALYEEVTPVIRVEPRTPEEKERHLQDVFKTVAENAQQASADQGKYYNLRRREWKPTIGDLVLLKQHHLSKAADGFAAKLAPRYDGPYRFIKYISPTILRLQNVGTKQ